MLNVKIIKKKIIGQRIKVTTNAQELDRLAVQTNCNKPELVKPELSSESKGKLVHVHAELTRDHPSET